MSDKTSTPGGRRKDGQPFKAGNTRDDGTYETGKNRPPPAHQFKAGDGRQRGRRAKGVRNADTEFQEELDRKIVVRENGKERKVSKSRAADIRLIENAVVKGQNRAIEMIDERRRRIVDKSEVSSLYNHSSDQQIMDAWFARKMAVLVNEQRFLGDPEPDGLPSEHDAGEPSYGD